MQNKILVILALTVAFLLEIVMWCTLGAVAFLFPFDLPIKILLFVVFTAAVIFFWAVFMSPKASKPLSKIVHTITKHAMYFVAFLIIYMTQDIKYAIAFIAIYIIDEFILSMFHIDNSNKSEYFKN